MRSTDGFGGWLVAHPVELHAFEVRAMPFDLAVVKALDPRFNVGWYFSPRVGCRASGDRRWAELVHEETFLASHALDNCGTVAVAEGIHWVS